MLSMQQRWMNTFFPVVEKEASVTAAFKKENTQTKTNLQTNQIFERFILNQMLPFIDNVMSSFQPAYRSRYIHSMFS